MMTYYVPLYDEVPDTTLGKLYRMTDDCFRDDFGDLRFHSTDWWRPIVLELE